MAKGSSDEKVRILGAYDGEVLVCNMIYRDRKRESHTKSQNNFQNLQCLVDMLASSSPSGFTTGLTLVFPAHFNILYAAARYLLRLMATALDWVVDDS